MTVAHGRGPGHTPGSHCFGAGGQGGHNFRASAPDGRTHLIPRSIRNTPPQQTVSKQYVPGVNIPSTQQILLSRRMAETNLTTSYVARSRYQLPIDSIPRHAGIREDGKFTGPDGDANLRAMVPCGVQPDPIISQQAIVTAPNGPTEGDSASTLVIRQASYGLRDPTSSYAGRTTDSPIPGVFFREDGTIYGPRIDGIQGSEQQDRGKAKAGPQIASSQSEASIVHQDDPQDLGLKRGANADPKRGAIVRKVTISVATDALLESTDPQHQPESMTVHHRSPSPKQGLINDPQDVGQEREEQVDPQPVPAPILETGTSMQDIDGDDAETQVQSMWHTLFQVVSLSISFG